MNRILMLLVSLLAICSANAQENGEIEGYMNRYCQAIKARNNDSIAAVCCELSGYYSYRDVDSTLKYTQEGLKHADRNTISPYLELMNNLGYYYSSIGETRESINMLIKTSREADRLNADYIMKGDILSSIGVGYRRMNQVDSALFYYNEALSSYQSEKGGSPDNEAFLLTNIAVLYANTSHREEAEAYIRKAIEKIERTEDLDTRLFVSNTAGAIFNIQGKYEEAEEIMLESLEHARKADKVYFVLQCTSPLLSLYSNTGNRAALDRLIEETQPWLGQLPENNVAVLGFQETIAKIYFTDKRYEESAAIYKKMLELNDENSQSQKDLIYLWLARNYVEMNRLREASNYYEKAYAKRDSVLNSDITRNLAEFSAKFDTQQKELEISRLNEEKLYQHNLMMKWGLLSGIAAFVLIMWLLYDLLRRRQQNQRRELEIARSFIDGLENERTRLAKELHDGICNDLLGIEMVMNLKDSSEENRLEIQQQIKDVRSEIRSISHELTPPKFQFASLNEIVKTMLEKLFIVKGIRLEISCDGEEEQWKKIPARHAYEAYRIIQELSSNIVRYADATQVKVSMSVTANTLDIEIIDNGKEFDPTKCVRRGIGLSTIDERVKAISAEFSMLYQEEEQIFRLQSSWSRK